MERYNIFYQVHKGLRALLYETALLLQHTDFTNAGEVEQAIEQLQTMVELFDKHAHTEDTLVFAAITPYEPSLVNAFEQEHEQDHALGSRINGIILSYAYAVSSSDQYETGKSINQAFIDFMIFNLNHMAKEEDIINKALWKHYSDAALHGITQKIIAGIPQPSMALFSQWMMRGLSNNEIINWMKEIKNNAPDPVFKSMFNMAQQQLNGNRWLQVQEALTEGAMVA
jgi:Hemerythrin HHE cation binding domain